MSSDKDKNFQKEEEKQENSKVVTPESDGEEVIENNEDSILKDEEDKDCIHVKKYQPDSDQGKKSKKQTIMSVKCLDCVKCDGSTEQKENAENQDLWLCMQCLFARCGRYSTNSHSLKHYEADNIHCLTFSFNTRQIWCYKCDAFVDPKLVKGKLESVTCKAKEAAAKNLKRPKSLSVQSHTVVENKELVDCKGIRTKSMRVIGLSNLGNTCYFNSALQNLLYLRPFRDQLIHTMTRTEYKLVPEKHPELDPITFAYINKPEKLTGELFKLMKETAYQPEAAEGSHSKKSSKKVITPRGVQNEIARKHRKFSNGSQQDSHELLRILIDMVKDEEIKRLKAAFLAHFGIKDYKTEFKTYPEDKKKLLRKYASEFKNVFVFFRTFIDDTFGGKMISTVNCLDCGNISDTNEHFLDISLALPEDSKRGKVHSQPQNKKPTNKQQKQLSKAEKKKVKKKNIKKMDLQTFQRLETSNTGRETENIELKNLDTPKSKNYSRGGEEGTGERSNVQKSENSPEHVTDMPTNDQPPDDVVAKSCVESEIQNNQNNEETGDHLNASRVENTDPQTDNNSEECSAAHPEDNNNNQLSDDRMDTKESTSKVNECHCEIDQSVHNHPLQLSQSEVESNSEKEVTIKPKEIKRLRVYSDVYSEGSLEYYLKQFFSPEFLEKDYVCTHCNRHLIKEQDNALDTNSDFDGDNDEKEDSTESIDLNSLHFSNAKKQFHIKTVGPVLTIHLKRFSQSGFRLQKVNRHINFPLVLDMSPFCVSDTSVRKDRDDRILYGLRGIVNHSGGMIAGHYVAYVNIADWNVPTKIPSKDSAKSRTTEENSEDRTSIEQPMDIDPAKKSDDNGMLTSENCACEPQSQPTPTPDSHLYEHVTPTEEWYYISDSHVSRTDHDQVFSSQAYILFYERLPLVTKDPPVL